MTRQGLECVGIAALLTVVLAPPTMGASLPLSSAAPSKPRTSPVSRTDDTQEPQEPKPADAPAETATQDGRPAERIATLDSLVITADRGVPLTYPGGRDVIDPETKAKYPDGNIATQLRRIPGVFYLPENANDSRISVGIRGNDPRRSALVALMVDGIPICEAPYGNTDVDGLPITPERIWRTDVIRGGGSIRYGPNSAGGIINFITEPIPEQSTVRLGSRVGTYGDYSEFFSMGGTYDKVGVLVSGTWKGGQGWRDNSTFHDLDGSIKVGYAISPTETLQAYVSRFTEPNAEQPGGLTEAAYEEDPEQSLREGSDFDFDMNRYVLGYTNQIDTDSAFQVKAWYQEGFRKFSDFRPVLQPFTQDRVQNSEFSSGALEASYSWSTEWFGAKNAFYHSARYLTEKNDELYTRAPIGGGPFVQPFELDALFRGQAFSLFTEDVISITEAVDFAVGFRMESISMNGNSHADDSDIHQDYTQFLPESNVTWKITPETAMYASYQRGFYPPQYETGFDPASVIYAPTKPESSDAMELGVRSHAIEGVEGSIALFDTEFYDKIDFINTPDGKVPINTGRVSSHGVEMGVNYALGTATDALDGFSVYGTLTLMRSEIKQGANEGNDSPNAPHSLASWGLDYEHVDTGLWARIGGSYSDGAYKDPANTEVGTPDGVNGPEPSFTLWDAAVGWNQRPDRSGFSVSVGVTNIFDEEYFRRFATGIYPGAPTEGFAVVSYMFTF